MTTKSRLLRWSTSTVLFLGLSTVAFAIDTDSDGLDDSVETNTGVYVSPANTGTNPNNSDSDADGVPDGLEVREKTSPLNATKFNSFSKGMTAFYPFDGMVGDKSGNNRNGSLYGNHQTLANGLKLVGDRSLYYTNGGWFKPNSTGLTNDSFSLSVWISYPSTGGIHPETHVLNLGAWGTPGMGILGFSYGTTANTLRAFVSHPDWSGFFNDQPITQPINHLTVVKENLNICFFINGVIVGNWNLPQNYQFFPSSFLSLNHHWWSAGSYSASRSSGTYSNFRLYSRALSEQEVANLARTESPRYKLIIGSYTWHEAKADAETRGGRLAMLNTQAKIDEAATLLSAATTWPNLWLGLTDELVEGDWRWIDGSLPTVTKWAMGEPDSNGGRNEDGTAIFTSDHGAWPGYWGDAEQGQRFSYVLENPSLTFNLSLTTTGSGSIVWPGPYESGETTTLTAIPEPGYSFIGWTGDASGSDNPLEVIMDADKSIGATFEPDLSDIDGDGLTSYDEVVIYGTDPTKTDTDADGLTDDFEVSRYSVVSGTFTWATAKTDAESKGGALATFANQVEWNQVLQRIGQESLVDVNGLWIGASDQTVEGNWSWISGEPFGFSSWAAGQPDNLNDSDFAAVAGDLGGETGKWYDYRATTTRDGYILESGYSTNPLDPDTDNDGVNDGEEYAAGSNPFVTDTDGDGLTDSQEVNLTETNPTLPDSDGDGLDDAADDQDGDSLSNLAEITQHGTDPLQADTDGDGLTDGAEISINRSYYTLVTGGFNQPQATADALSKRGRLASFAENTSYSNAVSKARRASQGYLWIGLSDEESEGTWKWTNGSSLTFNRWLNGQPDGGTSENHALVMENSSSMADGAAIFVAAGYIFERNGLDPLDPDTDGDGLNDGPEQNTHQTDPFDDDTDEDGLLDGAELNTHGSNPKLADTDSDGLGDREEVVVHGTNPAAKDSDGDGFDDPFEISTGFSPTSAASTPDALSSIRTAVEFRFNAANGVNYRIEDSVDLNQWDTIETNIIGQGGVVTRFYSTEIQPKRFLRVRRN